MSSTSLPPFVRDQKAVLSPADKTFLKRRMKRYIRGWTSFAVFVTLIMLFWYDPTPEFATYAFGVWSIGVLLTIIVNQKIISSNAKFITIGTVTSRFSRGEDRSRNKYSDDALVLEVNGKNIVVDRKTFQLYYRRDIVEFHYTDSGIILQHRLLKRGEKEFIKPA